MANLFNLDFVDDDVMCLLFEFTHGFMVPRDIAFSSYVASNKVNFRISTLLDAKF